MSFFGWKRYRFLPFYKYSKMQSLFLVDTLFIKSLFLLTFLKLKEDNDNLKEKQSKLEALVKTSEIEIENQTKKCAQLEHEISGKVCYFPIQSNSHSTCLLLLLFTVV